MTAESLFAALLGLFVALCVSVWEIAGLRDRVAALEAEVREVEKQ